MIWGMRIRITGTGEYRQVSLEYDILRTTTVMMVKLQISVGAAGFVCDEQKRFDIQPSEQILLYKGKELKNMQSVMDCGIQQSESLELAPTSHLVSITIHFGKSTIPLELKPTSTILGIKMLLKTVLFASFAQH